MIEVESRWNRIEILSVTITGFYRGVAPSDFRFVPVVTEMPAVSLELVDNDGDREVVGMLFGDALDDARRGAAKLSAEYGVPVLDHTVGFARRAQQ